MICFIHFETLIYIFEMYRTVMHSLKFSRSQIITIILNNLQLLHVPQLYLKLR